MVRMLVEITARQKHLPTVEAGLQRLADAVKSEEPGCLQYDLFKVKDQPQLIVVLEAYRDDQALAEHRSSPHYQASSAELKDMIEKVDVRYLDRLDA